MSKFYFKAVAALLPIFPRAEISILPRRWRKSHGFVHSLKSTSLNQTSSKKKEKGQCSKQLSFQLTFNSIALILNSATWMKGSSFMAHWINFFSSCFSSFILAPGNLWDFVLRALSARQYLVVSFVYQTKNRCLSKRSCLFLWERWGKESIDIKKKVQNGNCLSWI